LFLVLRAVHQPVHQAQVLVHHQVHRPVRVRVHPVRQPVRVVPVHHRVRAVPVHHLVLLAQVLVHLVDHHQVQAPR